MKTPRVFIPASTILFKSLFHSNNLVLGNPVLIARLTVNSSTTSFVFMTNLQKKSLLKQGDLRMYN